MVAYSASIFQLKVRAKTQQKDHCLLLANTCILYNLYKMSRQLIKLKTRQKMIEDTPNSKFSSNQSINMSPLVGIGNLKKGVQSPHSRGGVYASGSEAAAAAASISEEAAGTGRA